MVRERSGVRFTPAAPRARGGMADTTVSEAVVARHGSSNLSERTNSPGLKRRTVPGSRPARGHAPVAQSVEAAVKSGMLQVRVLRGAPNYRSLRQAAKASGLHPDIRRFESVREHHLLACSSMAEPALDRRLTWVRFPTGQPWTRSPKPEWRGSGLLTRGPVDRNHSHPLSMDQLP